ncbi:MAG: DNA/RNA non-specific endonuclease [Iphinoe sp. HA4291-MV1]|jgi:hypothetical protein|nr:DNA/RNA non-specific endonuclease [Iphinoe sp. HA4291-MV1]
MYTSATKKKPSLVWQGSTLDNYTLRLTQAGLERIISRLPEQPELKDFFKRNYKGNLKEAIVRSIAQLTQDALYTTSVFNRNSSKKLRVFNTQDATGRKYQILALPVSSMESTIVVVWVNPQVDAAEYAIVKTQPKHLRKYPIQHTHDGRTYYSRTDAQGRVTKIAGSLVYTKSKRIGTPKVPYKRKGDHAGHLIAHSFGGPPKFTGNFVAMKKEINLAGGDWGRMEAYIRGRLKAPKTKAWMSVKPVFANDKTKRPSEINVTVKFNRQPYERTFNIQTP